MNLASAGKSFLAAIRRLLNQFRPIIGAPARTKLRTLMSVKFRYNFYEAVKGRTQKQLTIHAEVQVRFPLKRDEVADHVIAGKPWGLRMFCAPGGFDDVALDGGVEFRGFDRAIVVEVGFRIG